MKTQVFERKTYEIGFNYRRDDEEVSAKLGVISLANSNSLTVACIMAITDSSALIPVNIIKPAQRELLLDPFEYLKTVVYSNDVLNYRYVMRDQIPMVNAVEIRSDYVTYELTDESSNIVIIDTVRKSLLDIAYNVSGKYGSVVEMKSISVYELHDDEVIAGVAIIHKGYVVSLPGPNRHHHVMQLVADTVPENEWPVGNLQGFITSRGRYVDRIEARKIAIGSGQFMPEAGKEDQFRELYSEDLW